MIGSDILLATLIILVAILLSVLIHGAISLFKEEDYLGGILCISTIIFIVGSLTGWALIVLGI